RLRTSLRGQFGMAATPEVHAQSADLGLPMAVGRWRVNQTKGQAGLRHEQARGPSQRLGIGSTKLWLVPRKRLCWSGAGGWTQLSWRGTKTSVTGEGLADVVLIVLSAETAISVMSSVLRRTIRGQMRHD